MSDFTLENGPNLEDPALYLCNEYISISHGQVGCSYHFAPDQRRALLDHLLASEGLPGVEEIAAMGEALNNLESLSLERHLSYDLDHSVYNDLNDAVDFIRVGLAAASDMSHNVAKWTPEVRRATLLKLLEAEAREHGIRSQLVINSDGKGAFLVQVHGGDAFGSHHISRTFYPHDSEDFIDQDCWVGMLMEFEARSAALAEKRKRESEASDE